MENIKSYLQKFRQYHFWVLSVLAIVALFYAWSTGTAEMEKEFTANKKTIDGHFKKIQSKNTNSQNSPLPNQKWIESRQQLTVNLKDNGNQAWDSILESQRSIQSWPESLSQECRQEIEDGKWSEYTVPEYKEGISKEIDRLRMLVGAVRSPEEPGVFWNENLREEVAGISKRQDVEAFQRELWVCEALLDAIKQTNKGATDQFDLPVHKIIDLVAALKDVKNKDGDFGLNLEEHFWKVREDLLVDTKTPKRGDKDGTRGNRKKSSERKKPKKPQARASMQPPLDQLIKKVPLIDGYDIVAFRLQIRMQVQFLGPLLRGLANAPIPLIIEGLRLKRDPSLALEHVRKPAAERETNQPRRSRIRKESTDKSQTTKLKATDQDTALLERGTLVEIWGYAYLVKTKPPKTDKKESRSARRLQIDLPTSG